MKINQLIFKKDLKKRVSVGDQEEVVTAVIQGEFSVALTQGGSSGDRKETSGY